MGQSVTVLVMGTASRSSVEKRHPIQVVSRRTGLSQEVLRIWEKRYGVVEPGRTTTGRRLYSDLDIERLRLLRQAIGPGRRIGTLARASLDQLRALVEEDRAAEAKAPPARMDEVASPQAARFLEECLAAVRALEPRRLEVALSRALVALSSPALIEDLFAPLARQIGELWQQGAIGPYQEHLATALIRQKLGEMLTAVPLDDAPTVVVTTPSGQRHEIGALLAAAAALGQGWRACYLGPDLPAGDIARAVEDSHAAAVAVSIVHPADDPSLPDELDALREHVGEGIAILVGGAAAPAYSAAIARVGARLLPDTRSFRKVLAELAADVVHD
jgi:DNA-binding transcriptional MerR regulator/methylmalonyl-CoA mutase cobalamin-binding subunit